MLKSKLLVWFPVIFIIVLAACKGETGIQGVTAPSLEGVMIVEGINQENIIYQWSEDLQAVVLTDDGEKLTNYHFKKNKDGWKKSSSASGPYARDGSHMYHSSSHLESDSTLMGLGDTYISVYYWKFINEEIQKVELKLEGVWEEAEMIRGENGQQFAVFLFKNHKQPQGEVEGVKVYDKNGSVKYDDI
jgi:hypothetical protein